MRRITLATVALLGLGCRKVTEVSDEDLTYHAVQEVSLQAEDGVKVHGVRYRPEQKGKVVCLMFHRAGSNAAEYKDIAPKLVAKGIECLAIDQRVGGDLWGRENKTAKESGKTDWKYEHAYLDMMAAYNWAKNRQFTKIVIWGSSYSASLALKLASENQVTAVVAFSPGEYFADKTQVARWNSLVKTACLFAFTKKEAMDGGYSLYQAAPKVIERKNDVLIARDEGVHGSETLLQEKSPRGFGYYWNALWSFFETNLIVKK